MKVLRRLYHYLRHYKAWGTLAFGSIIIFAVTQTAMIGLVQPLIDLLIQPSVKTKAVAHSPLPQPSAKPGVEARPSREEVFKTGVLNTVLKRDLPEGKRGWIVDR